jgi:hypothetical protein
MKITVNVDCTPQEARSFLGLPDLGPLQAALLGEMEGSMRAALASMDPEALMKTWFPGGMQGWEQLQKMFWTQLASGNAAARPGKGKEAK